jgi:hypothetical protein
MSHPHHRRHLIFAAIEKRGLQFLLEGEHLKRYKEWLSCSEEYKAKIREQAKDI